MEKLNKELILKLREGKIAAENTGTLQQLREVLKEAFPEDDALVTGYYRFYKKYSPSLWSGYAYVEEETFSIQDFYIPESDLSPTYEELLRQNREMREILEHVGRCLSETIYDKLSVLISDCLTSCTEQGK